MFVNIGDVNLHVADQGNGPTLLLVHGFPLDHTMWRYQLETLSSSYRIIAPDLRGFGLSGFTAHKVTMERFADDLAALLRVLDVDEPISFCGLSMGGYIGWQFYRKYKDWLGSLILCDTRAAGDSEDVAKGRMIMASRVLDEGPGFVPDAMIPKIFTENTIACHPEVVESTTQTILCNSAEGIAAAQRGMAERPDVKELLGQINLPTLLICGEHDVISPPSEMEGLAAAIPGARFVQIASAGHMAPLENPAAVNEALKSFLESTTKDRE